MNTQEYSKNLLDLVNESLGKKMNWDINTISYDELEAYTTIQTVAGPRTLIVYFNGTRVLPMILLKKEDDLDDEATFELFGEMNAINHLYGNTVVAFMISDDSDDLTVALRGINFVTFQNESSLTRQSFRKGDPIVTGPAGAIVDFIQNVNNDFGTDTLRNLIQMFN